MVSFINLLCNFHGRAFTLKFVLTDDLAKNFSKIRLYKRDVLACVGTFDYKQRHSIPYDYTFGKLWKVFSIIHVVEDIHTAFVMAYGWLTDTYSLWGLHIKSYGFRFLILCLQAACKAAADYCKKNGKNISKLALQYSLLNKDISTVLVGMNSVRQVCRFITFSVFPIIF